MDKVARQPHSAELAEIMSLFTELTRIKNVVLGKFPTRNPTAYEVAKREAELPRVPTLLRETRERIGRLRESSIGSVDESKAMVDALETRANWVGAESRHISPASDTDSADTSAH